MIGPATCALLGTLSLTAPARLHPTPAPEPSFPPFGTLTLYHPAGQPSSVVLFASGDGGWNRGVIGMARRLQHQGALVIGFDVRTYLGHAAAASGCTYAAADLQALAQFVEREEGMAHYQAPVLAGYSSGATLVYIALAQAPPNTFRGGLSLGFCSDLEGTARWCPGTGHLEATPTVHPAGWDFRPVSLLPAPWIVLEGTADQVCAANAAGAFVAQVADAEFDSLPKVGHGFGVPANWGPAYDRAFARLLAAPPADVRSSAEALRDLPLVEVPAAEAPAGERRFAIMLSGDGGWAGLDRDVSGQLAREGIPVVGLDALQYFWHARTPEELAADLARIVEHYSVAWHRDRVLLLGYSFGADVLPATVAALPASMRGQVDGVGLVGLGTSAEFEFHVGSWLGRSGAGARPTAPDLARLPALLGAVPVVCISGAEETETGCRGSSGVTDVQLSGGHHLGGDYQRVAATLLERFGAAGH